MVDDTITGLYEYFVAHPDALPEDLKALMEEFGKEEMVKDYVAGMTDRYALSLGEMLL